MNRQKNPFAKTDPLLSRKVCKPFVNSYHNYRRKATLNARISKSFRFFLIDFAA